MNSSPDGGGRRSQILAAAAHLFSERGYRATRLEDVAEVMNFTRAALYYYFRSKSEMLAELIGEAGATLTEQLEEAVTSHDEPVLQLSEAVRRHTLAYLREPHVYTLFRLELAELPPATRDRLAEEEDAYVHDLSAIVARAMKDGSLRALPPMPVTLAVLAMANSAATWFRPEGELTQEETADLIVDLCLNGLRVRTPMAETHDSEWTH